MKILVTGASGLLGTDIAHLLEANSLHVLRQSFRARPGFVSADLSSKHGIDTLCELDWDTVIHSAASRDPDICEKDRESAYKLNVLSAKLLAEEAEKRKARIIFISSDYVFPGTEPPYSESTTPSPVNYYGTTKLEAENIIMKTCSNHCILRVPVLYGIRAGLESAVLLSSSLKAVRNRKETYIDNYIVRYPTFTEDVASVILFLIRKDMKGIFHFSGNDRLTKFDIAKIIAEVSGLDSSHIIPLDTEPVSTAKRPRDSHLDCSKIISLGLKEPAPFRQIISNILPLNL